MNLYSYILLYSIDILKNYHKNNSTLTAVQIHSLADVGRSVILKPQAFFVNMYHIILLFVTTQIYIVVVVVFYKGLGSESS